MPIISEKVFKQEFARIEPEKYRSRRMDWEHAWVPIIILFSTYIFVLTDFLTDHRLTLTSWLILPLFTIIFFILVCAKSLEQDWKESVLTKISMARFEAKTNYPLLRDKKWTFDNYDLKYIYTDSKFSYFAYQATKFFCYGISYPIIFAVGALAVISRIFPDIFL